MNNKKKLFILAAVALVMVITACAVFAGCAVRDDSNGDSLGIGEQNGGQRLVTGLLVAALGVMVVFILLLVLILLINVFSKALKGGSILSEKTSAFFKKKLEARAAKKALNAPQKQEQIAIAAPEESDDEIAAVMAAVYAVLSAEAQAAPMSDLKFKVKSVKRLKSL